ncbi:hypothetical protein MXF13_02055 [Leclercia adecarboxylata]|uniref:hypothetical protein n=1 Tax=Leclercia adecarboxylata TaxID=83655 RepID=UPI002DB78F70|nr:hypothetical protein [Leclercia adecarboxylata]MEB5748672.1 hypothetical protein [Leclercia adecarboxylata]
MMKVFRSDLQSDSELAYREWLCDNPEGFVVNTLKRTNGLGNKSDERFTRIHRAGCKTINPLLSQQEKTGFTTGNYQKICVTSLTAADLEAQMITGLKSTKRCPCV